MFHHILSRISVSFSMYVTITVIWNVLSATDHVLLPIIRYINDCIESTAPTCIVT